MRLRYLVPTAIALAAVLFAEAAFIIYWVETSPFTPRDPSTSSVGLTASIGAGLFTKYLMPFEITSILLLMAIVGAMTLARRAAPISAAARVIPGAQVLTRSMVNPDAVGDATEVVTHSTAEAEELLRERERLGARDKDF